MNNAKELTTFKNGSTVIVLVFCHLYFKGMMTTGTNKGLARKAYWRAGKHNLTELVN